MPSRTALWTWIKLLGLALAVLDHAPVAAQSNSPQTCPPGSDISPCVCQVKKNGLDILCEATDVQHITKAMSALKGKSPIIFYLKLRHNNLPKLQGFVFLALDIRHLTIHNSSLATIEETSLSSLGKICFPYLWLYSVLEMKRNEPNCLPSPSDGPALGVSERNVISSTIPLPLP